MGENTLTAVQILAMLSDMSGRLEELTTLANVQQARINDIIAVQATTSDIVHNLSLEVSNTAQVVNALSTTIRNSSWSSTSVSGTRTEKNYVAAPAKFKGEGDLSESRFFLASFANWARNMSTLNVMSSSGAMVRDDQKWIASVLNFLEDKARSWALPALEKIAEGKQAYQNWQEFDDAFRKRFEPVNVKKAAQEAIKALKQGKLSVEQYKARFDEQSPRTGYPDDVLAEHYYKGLTERVKDVMMGIGFDREKMDSVHAAAQEAGDRIRQRDGETKNTDSSLDKGKATASHDPNAMEIDAARTGRIRADQPGPNGKTVTDWRKALVNRCNRCGSTDHIAKNGNHDRDICSWCKKVGHKSTACMSKFMGYPQVKEIKADGGAAPVGAGQGIAATIPVVDKDKDEQKKKMKELEEKIAELMKEQAAIKAVF